MSRVEPSRHFRAPFELSRVLARWLVGMTLFLGPFAASAAAQPWWSDCFTCRRQVTVTTGTAPVGAGYSVSVTFDHSALTPSKSQPDGDDVRILHWNGLTWTELDRVLDPLSAWDSATTTIWFALVDPIAASSSDSNYYLYYGNPFAVNPPNDWANVFRVGDDFEDGTITGGLTTSTSGTASITESGGEHVLSGGGAVGDAGISVTTNPLAASRQFAIRHKVKNVSGGGPSGPEAKVVGIVDSPAQPTTAPSATENPRRQIVILHRVSDGGMQIIYFDDIGNQLHWDGAVWSLAFPDWSLLPLDTYHIYDVISDGTSWHIVVRDAAGTVLTTTTPVTWVLTRDLGNDSWFYFGEVYTDFYFVDQKSDWVYVRDYVDPEPTVSLAAESSGAAASTVNYRSIGMNAGALASGADATIAAAGTTVTFGSGTLPMNIGIGDEIVIGAETFHILTRDSATQVTVQAGGGAHTNAAYTISRAFSGATALQDWETARQGDLVAENRREIGVAYNDAPFTSGMTFETSTTDSCHFMKLTAAPGHRHSGRAGTGVLLDGGDSDQGIRVQDDYTVVEWFEFTRNRNAASAASIVIQQASNVLIQNLVIYDFADGVNAVSGVRAQTNATDYVVRNSIIYNGDSAGIRNNDSTASGTVENCTTYSNERGLLRSAGTLTVTNTIALGNSIADFSGTMSGSHNMSTDGTAFSVFGGDPNAITGASSATEFVDDNVATADLHLAATSTAVEAGTDLGGSFCCDIDAEGRPWGALWDMGADERPATPLCPVTQQSWYDRDWSLRKALVIDASKVSGVLTDYPVLINLASDAELAASAQDPNGDDILFTASDGVTKLSHEIEKFDGTTGELVAWVKVPYLSSGANTTLYMYFGNGASGNQQDVVNVWTAGFEAVWHQKESPTGAAGDIRDSTVNAVHGTSNGMDGTNQLAGRIDGSLVYDGAAEYVQVGVPGVPMTGQQSHTLSAWARFDPGHTALAEFILEKGGNYWLWWNGDNSFALGDDTLVFGHQVGAGQEQLVQPWAPLANTWYHIVGVHDAAADTNTLYVNGGFLVGGGAPSDVVDLGGLDTEIGRRTGSGDKLFDGQIDEVRIASVSRSLAWIETEFSNQNDPAGFVNVCAAATAVELLSFDARGSDGAVELRWVTGSELDNLGFHIYRAASELGEYKRVTETPIPGLGSSPAGASYSYLDGEVQNGTTYYYLLEDIDTMGASERHGPVSATPENGIPVEPAPPPEDGDIGARMVYGDPDASAFRIVPQTSGVVLVLDTAGFTAVAQKDGTVRLEVPTLREIVGSSLPVKRAWIEAVAGRGVQIVSVRARQIERFDGLQPSSALVPELEASPNGTVRAQLRRRGHRLIKSEGAELIEVAYQGETKRALFELSPFAWDGSALLMARKLEVRVAFRGREASSRPRGNTNNQVAVRLVTAEPGLYAVRLDELVGKRHARTSALRLSRQGVDVAYHVEEGTLYFWSEGADENPYGHEAVYELELGVSGKIMEVVGGSDGVSDTYFWQTLEREENRYYQATFIDSPDVWAWELLFAHERKSFAFDVRELATVPESASLQVWLHGASDMPRVEDHHMQVLVNGSFVAETHWDGKRLQRLEAVLPPGLLREGSNTLELENAGDTGAAYSMFMLDRFHIRYPRRVDVLQNARFVLDVTGASPSWVDSRVRFDPARSYLAFDAAHLPEARAPRATNLRQRRRADYLVIGPQAFIDSARPLLRHRGDQGLRVATASTEAIASEFGHGELSPEAIRELISYAYHEWPAPRLRYVLLLGDATYDFKDYLGTGVGNPVPPLIVRTSYLWTASDPAYASVHGDDSLPDLAIGRLPAASASEVQTMVEKILSWETRGVPRVADGPVVLVADNADRAGNFEADADELASSILYSTMTRRIYASRLGTEGTRAAIREAFNEGASSVSYLGHGGIHLWADERVFDNSTVDALTAQSHQPLVLTLNCLNGYFHFPHFDSLGEKLVKARSKGAIAAVSPSGLSLNGPAHRFHQALLTELFLADHERLGDALLAAQRAYAESGAWPELLRIYHLFGDPALSLR